VTFEEDPDFTEKALRLIGDDGIFAIQMYESHTTHHEGGPPRTCGGRAQEQEGRDGAG